ncbi:hypothetical protein Q8A73_009655 [Channa argus]|nr:hypothetical protein Q8A73_009655 [Channa argus]
MERSIGELERAVLESSVLLEHLKQGAWRKTGELHRPDGTRVPRSTHRYPNHERQELLPLTPVKLPRYNGLTPLEPYLAQVDLAALHGGWSGEETATHLALALEGPVLQVLADLLPEDRRELRAITGALKRRFGYRTAVEQSREQLAGRYRQDGESVGAFATDVPLYTQPIYPTFPAAAREELSLHSFLRGLAQERLCQHVRLAMPQSLDEALKEAECAEEVLGAGSAPGRSLSRHRPVRAASWEVAGESLEGEGTSRAQQAGAGAFCRCVVYLDDLLVHVKGFENAISNLSGVFTAIRQAGLRLNPAKCHSLARETQFLGHMVSERGVTKDQAKVALIKEWPQPTTTSELRSFLRLASYYRRFVKDFATIASPLHRVTEKGRRFEWSEACSVAFQQLKTALSEAPVLAYPDPQQPFVVDTDASEVGIGAVLSQGGETGERVVAYYSCLSRAERNYCH